MAKEIIQQADANMKKALEALQKEISKLRTGRASISVLDDVRVEYYGQQVPLNQVATLGVPEPRMITVSPWEQNLIPEIERAIIKANIGLSPVNDGKLLRLPIPALTEDRRKDIVKVLKKHAEEARVSIRHARRDMIDGFKSLEKAKEMTEDEVKKATQDAQKLTDDFTAKVDSIVEKKEQEIMTV